MSYPELSVLIPAAGASTRLGQAKQLVEYKGKPLIQNAVDVAHSIAPGQVIVVTGANAPAVREAVQQPLIHWQYNQNWACGMGTSIALGMASLGPQTRGVLILLCDQWRLESQDLKTLSEIWRLDNQRIVCANVGNADMPPAIFPSTCFNQLKSLQGDRGARSLLKTHPEMVTQVSMKNAGYDLNTPEQMVGLKEFI